MTIVAVREPESTRASSNQKELLREFQCSLMRTERARALTAIGTGAALYLLFILLDRSLYPGETTTLLLIRLIAVAFMALGIVVVARAKTYWGQVIPSALTWVVGAGAIGMMCHATEGFSSPYWAGLPLCGIAATIFTWPPKVAAISFGLGLLPYYAPLLSARTEVDYAFLAMVSAFVLATYILALIGLEIQNRLAFRAFLSHQKLERSHEQLAELDKSKNRMFQNVSHELRTPLTLMLGPLERRIRGQSNFGVSREGVETLHRHGLRLLKLINDLLDLAQLTTAELPVVRKTIDLRRFVQLLVEDAKVAADASNLALVLELPPSAIFYSVDPRHLERILLNLLSNAIKFTKPGGEIRVQFQSGLTHLRVSVSDNGPGIAQADQGRIFERFEQAEGSSGRDVGGAGIGLALVRELAELLEGQVTVDSATGQGACFTLALPARFLRARADGSTTATAKVNTAFDRQALRAALYQATAPERIVCGRRGARVLIAEDDPDLRLQLAEMLQERYRVVAVSDGQAALEEANAFLPHLVITDVMMPRLDGIELCRQLRQQLQFRRTAVLMLTARGALDARVEGRASGADSYLTKPFDTQELLSAVRGLLRSRMHVVGDFLLHHRLGRGGQSTVFMAEHLISGKPAAVKIIARNTERSTERRARTRLEVQALTRLRHPNIVKILADYEHQGDFFLAMEYLPGTSIHTCLEELGHVTCGEASAIAHGIAQGLHHAHQNGLVHRDVKCSNVILTTDPGKLSDRARLIDFGSATFLDSDQGNQQGTPAYMAPEVFNRTQDASIQSDIYSLGVMLFRMCTGHHLFDSPQLEDFRHGRLSRSGWRERLGEASAELEPILSKSVAFEPSQRWSSAKDLADALAPLADQQSTVGSKLREPRRSALTPTHPITPFDSSYAS